MPHGRKGLIQHNVEDLAAAGRNHGGRLSSLLSWSPFVSFQQARDREAMNLCFVSHRELQDSDLCPIHSLKKDSSMASVLSGHARFLPSLEAKGR